MTGAPQAPAPQPDNGGLGMRHVRAAVGILFMLFGATMGALAAYVDMKNELAGKAVVSSLTEFATEYGFPALIFLAGLLLFSREAFTDLIAAGKGLLPGQKS